MIGTKKRLSYFLTALIILAIFSAMFFSKEMYPFGDKSISWGDMNQQSIPLLSQLCGVIRGDFDISANFATAGGMNFWAVLLFFVASPTNLIAVFVPTNMLVYFINIFVVFKIILCGLSACFMFRKFFKLPHLMTAVLSCMYAMSGFSMMYFQNIIWFDTVFLFPILLCTLKVLKEKNKIYPLTICLCAIIAVNFYMSYMVAVFILVALFLFCLFYRHEQWAKKFTLGVTLSGACSVLICMPFLLPTYIQYSQSARETGILESLSYGNITTNLWTTTPILIATSVILAVFVPLLTRFKKLDKNVLFVISLYILCLVPVFIDPINKMWHTGSYQCFPVRYGYITIMLGLFLTAMIVQKAREKDNIYNFILLGLSTILPLILACVLIKNYPRELTEYSVTLWGNEQSLFLALSVSILCIIIYALSMIFLTAKKMQFVFLMLLVVESYFNINVYMTIPNRYITPINAITKLTDKIDDDSFYNVQVYGNYFDTNWIGAIGYNNFAHYTSLTDEKYMSAMKKLGYSSYWMEVATNGGTHLSNSVLANKYCIYRNSEVPKDSSKIYSTGDYTIVENPFNANFGVLASEDLLNYNDISSFDRMEIQNDLYKLIYNESENLFERLEPSNFQNAEIIFDGEEYTIQKIDKNKKAYIEYEVENTDQNTYYFDIFDQISIRINEFVNASFDIDLEHRYYISDYPRKKENGLLKLHQNGVTKFTVQLELLKDKQDAKSFGIYKMENEQLAISQNNITYPDISYENGKFTAQIDNENDSCLFLPIHYSEGISAQINGKDAQVYRVFDSFTAIKLENGENDLVVSFKIPFMLPSIVISLVGITILYFLNRLYAKNKLEKFENISCKFVFALSCLCVVMVYIFPLFIWAIF